MSSGITRLQAGEDVNSEYDWRFNGDAFGFSAGGDGDNGEELMYLLDEYFAVKDSEAAAARSL